MNCIDSINSVAYKLLDIISNQKDAFEIPTPDYGWKNYRYRSPKFRLGHVQIFEQDRFSVVHVCVFPHATDPAPIYGFDVVSGENKITGVFLDLSPTVLDSKPFINIKIDSKIRERPEWGKIFSPHWLACRPNLEEMEIINAEAIRVLTCYLTELGDIGDQKSIIEKQNTYCLEQQKNEHTRKALTKILGADGADDYMSKILFPTICN